VGKKRKKQGIQPVIKRKINELYDFSLQNKNLTAFLWENGVKAKQQKKSPAGFGPAFQRCTFSLRILVKVKVPKRKPLPTARFSSKFCYKGTCV